MKRMRCVMGDTVLCVSARVSVPHSRVHVHRAPQYLHRACVTGGTALLRTSSTRTAATALWSVRTNSCGQTFSFFQLKKRTCFICTGLSFALAMDMSWITLSALNADGTRDASCTVPGGLQQDGARTWCC